MPPGPPPQPTYLKLLKGNPGRRPLNTQEPQPLGDLTDAPAWMTASQKAVWDDAIRVAPPGLLKQLDKSMLTAYVLAADLLRIASEKIAEYGAIVKAPLTGVPMQSPYVSIQNKQAQIMMRACAEMGFSPSSRSRVKVDSTPPQGKFSELKELGD